MPKVLLAVLAVLIVSAPVNTALAGAAWIGPASCGDWSTDLQVGRETDLANTTNNIRNGMFLNWVMGFLSGASWETHGCFDYLKTLDSAGIAGWLDNYCPMHPLQSVADAADELTREIRAETRK